LFVGVGEVYPSP